MDEKPHTSKNYDDYVCYKFLLKLKNGDFNSDD